MRYWAAATYLDANPVQRGGRVLVADSRDLIFQRDPFTIPHVCPSPFQTPHAILIIRARSVFPPGRRSAALCVHGGPLPQLQQFRHQPRPRVSVLWQRGGDLCRTTLLTRACFKNCCLLRHQVKLVLLSPPRPVSCSGTTMGSYAETRATLPKLVLPCRNSCYPAETLATLPPPLHRHPATPARIKSTRLKSNNDIRPSFAVRLFHSSLIIECTGVHY